MPDDVLRAAAEQRYAPELRRLSAASCVSH